MSPAVRVRRSLGCRQRWATAALVAVNACLAAQSLTSFAAPVRVRAPRTSETWRNSAANVAKPASVKHANRAAAFRHLAGSGGLAAAATTAVACGAAASEGRPSARLYFIGIAWYLSHFVVGIGNDGIMKFLGSTIPPFQVVFVRFAAAAAILLPIMLFKGKEAFKSARLWMHGCRGLLLALGIALWCYALKIMPFASCVVVNNTMPFFKMIFATLILGEKVGKERWIASIAGFIGCLIVFNPTAATFKPQSLVLVLAAMCFAMLDIFNKKYSTSESVVSMLFYGSVATALIASVRAIPNWVPLTTQQWGLFGLLGVGANLLLFCLLKAFSYVDASATCPYRYAEFVLSAVIGFLAFGEKPMTSTLLGSAIILPAVVYAAMAETRK